MIAPTQDLEVHGCTDDEAPGHGETAPEFSIVMPCLNEAETLARCIEKAQRAFANSGSRVRS